MPQNKVERLRGLIMFVIAWLIGLYVYEVVQEHYHGTIGFLAAALTMGVNIYARRRAMAGVETGLTSKFWLYLPVMLFFLVPIGAKVIIFLTSEEAQSWWAHVSSLLPFILKLGVPVGTLLWVYWSLARLPVPAPAPAQPAPRRGGGLRTAPGQQRGPSDPPAGHGEPADEERNR